MKQWSFSDYLWFDLCWHQFSFGFWWWNDLRFSVSIYVGPLTLNFRTKKRWNKK